MQPTDTQVPRISLQVPARNFAHERGAITRAISMMSFNFKLPLCLMFLSCMIGNVISCYRRECGMQA